MRPLIALRRPAAVALAVSVGASALSLAPTPLVKEALATDCMTHADYITVLEDHQAWVPALANDSCNYATNIGTPGHGTVTDDPMGPGVAWYYTPNPNYNGSDAESYVATYDGSTFHKDYVFYTVTPVNDPPSLTFPNPPHGTEDTPGEYPFNNAAVAGPTPDEVDTQTLSASIAFDPPSLLAAPPTVTLVHPQVSQYWHATIGWTPAPNACGSGAFVVAVKDDGGTANGGFDTTTVNVPFTIDCVNDAPVANNDAYATRAGTTLVVPAGAGLLANDTDIDTPHASLMALPPTVPAHGTVSMAVDGGFTYAPDTGFTGIDSFAYIASDGSLRTTATVAINVDGTPPAVSGRAPASGASGVARDVRPSVTFSEAIAPATVTASTVRLRDATTGTSLVAAVTYDAAARRATLVPSALLAAGHTFRVTATNGITDLAGNALAATSWTFKTTTDATRPTVVKKVPASSATGVSRTANVSATFSEAMRASTVTTATVRLQDTTTGAIVPAVVSYSATYRRATLNPSGTLAARRTYKVLLSSSIRDRAGNRLPATTWSFRTGG